MLLPTEVIKKIEKTEIDNVSNLILRLKGERPYPIKVSLKQPTVKSIMADISAYENFIKEWNYFEYQDFIERTTVNYKYGVNGNDIPSDFVIDSFESLMKIISTSKRNLIENFITRAQQLSECLNIQDQKKFYHLFKILNSKELSEKDFRSLIVCLPQLKRGMGKDLYLRAIPIDHIDTKFIEKHDKLIEHVLLSADVLTEFETLENYLGVMQKPLGFAHIRVLDKNFVDRYPYMMVPANDLEQIEPPCDNIIIVENVQSGLMIPSFDNTTVIFGCGKNLSWATCDWLKRKKKIIYWGDLDSWGYQMLCDIRSISKLNIKSILMDISVFERSSHKERMVHEESSIDVKSEFLTTNEKEGLSYLLNNGDLNRLEQEKLDEDFIVKAITEALK